MRCVVVRSLKCFIVAVSAGSAPLLLAQDVDAPRLEDSSVVAIMRLQHGRTISAADFTNILRQRYRAHSRARQDSLADSLAALVLSTTDSVGLSYERARLTLLSLITASERGGTGQPYQGGLDRLIRIHQQSRLRGIRSTVIWFLSTQDESGRAIAYLRTVATSSGDNTAATAMGQLVGAAIRNEPGVEGIVRAIWLSNEARDPMAQRVVDGYAASKGWKKP